MSKHPIKNRSNIPVTPAIKGAVPAQRAAGLINYNHLNSLQIKGLIMQLNKIDLHNRALLFINKNIEKFPHTKINDKLVGSLNQNIVFNFSNKNVNTDRRLINTQLSWGSKNDVSLSSKKITTGGNAIKLLKGNIDRSVTDFGPVLVKNPSRLGIINNAVKIISSFFNGLSSLISRPQFINKADKLIVRVYFFQNNNFNKDALFSNNKSNFIYNLFYGTAAAKAQYSAPKSQNFVAVIRDMLGQTKWNKKAQSILNNNENINSVLSAPELANIPKKVFILFIKDLINLIASNKGLSIQKALSLLGNQKGSASLVSLIGKNGVSSNNKNIRPSLALYNRNGRELASIKKYNQLFLKLKDSTNSEALTRKRTRLSKTFSNKSLLAQLRNKVNNHNNSLGINSAGLSTKKGKSAVAAKELIGKGLLLNPVNKKKLERLLAWSDADLSEEYKLLSIALLELLKNKEINSQESKSSLSASQRSEILSHKINQNLTSLSTQFSDEVKNNINFIIKKTLPLRGTTVLKGKKPTNTKLTKLVNALNLPLGDSNALKFIKLIHKNIASSTIISTKEKGKILTIVKEAIKAYNLSTRNKSVASSGIIGGMDNLKRFKLLGNLLAKIFKKNIDLQIVKVHNAGLDPKIMSQVIALNARFDKSSTLLKKLWRKVNVSNAALNHFNKQNIILNGDTLAYDTKLFNKTLVPVFSKFNKNQQLGVKIMDTIPNIKKNISFAQLNDQIKSPQVLNSNPLVLGKVAGLSVRIAGRIKSDPQRPKQTVKTASVGNFSKERTNISSLGSFTSKHRKGNFTITVKMGHARTYSTSPRESLS